MGFGYLVFGYLFFADFNLRTASGMSFDVMPDLVAWLFLAIGYIKLGKWSPLLRFGTILCVAMTLPSALLLCRGLKLFPDFLPEIFFVEIFPLLDVVCRLVFHYFLLYGVWQIASSCEGQEDFCKSLKYRVLLVSVCFLLLVAARIALIAVGESFLFYAALIASILTVCYLIPVEVSLYQAYQRITLG